MHQQHVNCMINTWVFVAQNMAVNSVRHCFLCNNEDPYQLNSCHKLLKKLSIYTQCADWNLVKIFSLQFGPYKHASCWIICFKCVHV